MADVDAQLGKTDRKKLTALYQALRETQAKEFEITEEIGRVLAGDPGIGDKLKDVEAHFATLWRERYKGAYVWAYVKDRPQMKRLIRELGSVDELKARIASYFVNGDPFYAQARHSFALFVSTVNKHAGLSFAELELDVDAPADCRHSPRCKTDQEHTRKRSAELRA